MRVCIFYVCFLLMLKLKKKNKKKSKEEKRIKCFNLYIVKYFKDK